MHLCAMICVSLLWVSFVAITGVLTLLGKKNPNRHLTLSRTLLLDTLVGHSTWHSCGTLTLYLTRLLDTCIWHGFWRASYLALLLGTLVGRSYLTFWLDTLAYLTHVYAGHPHMTIPRNTLLDTLTWHAYLTHLEDTPLRATYNRVK